MSAVVENLTEIAAVDSAAVDLPPENSTLPLLDERPEVQLPGPGLEVSAFAQEVGEIVGQKTFGSSKLTRWLMFEKRLCRAPSARWSFTH